MKKEFKSFVAFILINILVLGFVAFLPTTVRAVIGILFAAFGLAVIVNAVTEWLVK